MAGNSALIPDNLLHVLDDSALAVPDYSIVEFGDNRVDELEAY